MVVQDWRRDGARTELAREHRHDADGEAEMGRLAAQAREDPEVEEWQRGFAKPAKRGGLRGLVDRLTGGRR
jgi:hypothetical protein